MNLDLNSDSLLPWRRQWHPHSSTLAWKIPWMEKPGGLQSMGSLRVRHDWAASLSLFTFMHWRRKWQPTPVFLPGELQGQGTLVGCRLCCRRVGKDWSDAAAAAVCFHILKQNARLKWPHQKLPNFFYWGMCSWKLHIFIPCRGFPVGSVVKNLPAMQKMQEIHGFHPWVGKILWRRAWQPTPVFLP